MVVEFFFDLGELGGHEGFIEGRILSYERAFGRVFARVEVSKAWVEKRVEGQTRVFDVTAFLSGSVLSDAEDRLVQEVEKEFEAHKYGNS
jgi:hypothetical protein